MMMRLHARRSPSPQRARSLLRSRAGSAEPRRARQALAREIAIVLIVKCVALSAIWSIWFTHPESRNVDAERMSALLYGLPHHSPHEGSPSNAQP